MLGQAVLFVLFLLFGDHQSQECTESTENRDVLSGSSLWLRPSNMQIKEVASVQWRRPIEESHSKFEEILNWRPSDGNNATRISTLTSRYDFNTDDFALCIESARPLDSGCYQLEVTFTNGSTCREKFQIRVLDHVETPHLVGQWTALANGTCQLSLYCSMLQDDNVSCALYRGSELISTQRNATFLESQADSSSLLTYTCNVSNQVSWTSQTLNFTQGCQNVSSKPRLLPFVVIIVTLVFLGAVTGVFYMWNKKRKQSQSGPKEILTIYEDVKIPEVRRDQEQRLEQTPFRDGGTIYSMIQYKPSGSTSQEKCTIYSVVQSSKKSGSRKRNQSPSLSHTVYEEVGKQCLKAHNPARLSRRELENFDVYS